MAAGADVAHLGVAHGAHDKILLDGAAALGAAAVLGKLALAQGHVELLLFAICHVGIGAQHQVSDEAHERDEGDDAPSPEGAHTAALGVDEHVHHGQDVQGGDKTNEQIDRHHELRRHELLDVLRHASYLSNPQASRKVRIA